MQGLQEVAAEVPQPGEPLPELFVHGEPGNQLPPAFRFVLPSARQANGRISWKSCFNSWPASRLRAEPPHDAALAGCVGVDLPLRHQAVGQGRGPVLEMVLMSWVNR